MSKAFNISAIYEEIKQEDLNDCITIIGSEKTVEKIYLAPEREMLMKYFLSALSYTNNFDKLTSADRKNILKLSKFFSEKYSNDKRSNNWLYSFLYTLFTSKVNLIEGNNYFDKLQVLLIEVIDPELKIYYYMEDYIFDAKSLDENEKIANEIYKEEAKKKIIEEFGFFDDRIVKLEKNYIDKFDEANQQYLETSIKMQILRYNS